MSRSLDELLYAEEDEEVYADDSGSSGYEDSESEYDGSTVELSDGSQQQQSSPTALVNLASPSANTPSTQNSATFQHTEDDDDVQILTAAEAAAEMAAAARRAVETPSASRKRKRPLVETKAEPTECTICCDDCTIAGRHRLVALKCGHLFGKKCIERWISEKQTCPNCSAIVRRTDICLLFSDHVAVVDNSGLEGMTNKFEEEKKKSSKLEKEMAVLKQQLEARTKEATRLNLELTKFKKVFADLRNKAEQKRRADAAALSRRVSLALALPVTGASLASPTRQTTAQGTQAHTAAEARVGYSLLPAISTSQPLALGNEAFATAIRKYKPIFDVPLLGARVFCISRSCTYICIGEKLAQGPHGIFMLRSHDTSHRVQIPIHTSDVRDICIHHQEKHVLTVAFDGKLALTSLDSNKVVLQVELPPGRRHGWSCSFSETDPVAMYCGFQDGTVAKYDVRKAISGEQGIVKNFSLPERQPVHSIKSFKTSEGREGLAAATFRGLSVWRDVTDVPSEANRPVGNGSVGALPFSHVPSDQACFSLASNQLHSNQMVVSSRSTPMKHSVFDLHSIGVGRLAPRMEFIGHKAPSVLSRSAMWSEADGTSVVASWSHDIERVTLWNVATHREVCGPEPASLSVASAAIPVVDIQHAVAKNSWSSGVALLGTMTARQLCVFRSGG